MISNHKKKRVRMIQRRLLTHAGRVVWLTMEIFFLHTTFFFNTPSNTRKKNQKYPYIFQWISNSRETYKLMDYQTVSLI